LSISGLTATNPAATSAAGPSASLRAAAHAIGITAVPAIADTDRRARSPCPASFAHAHVRT